MRSITSKLLIPFLIVLSAGIVSAQRTSQARVSFEAVTQNYFPLAPGNSWTYVVTGFAAQGSVTVRVSRAVDINGVRYYELLGYTPEPAVVRLTRSGQLIERRHDSENRWFDREFLWYDFAAPQGASWESGMASECNGQASVAAPPESVQVPAGTFSSLVRISYQGANCADAGLEEEIFAEGIGLVRRTSITIGGPRSIELVSAQIGGKQIAPKGLTVSLMIDKAVYVADLTPPVDPARSVPVLHAQFKIENTGEQPLDITVPTSQEFDLVIRNESGTEVFRWSDGKVFAQALAQLRFNPGERVYSVDAPLQAAAGQPLAPGRYTVEAWLSTAAPKLYQATTAFELQHVF